jgi:hypothetical protein
VALVVVSRVVYPIALNVLVCSCCWICRSLCCSPQQPSIQPIPPRLGPLVARSSVVGGP